MSWENQLFNSIQQRFNRSNPSRLDIESRINNPFNNEQFRAVNMIFNIMHDVPTRIRDPITRRISSIPPEQSRFIDLGLESVHTITPSTMIIGPPGTGKTEVIVCGAILFAFQPHNLQAENRIKRLFIATFTNAGSYRIFEKIHQIANQVRCTDYYNRIKLVQAELQTQKQEFNRFLRANNISTDAILNTQQLEEIPEEIIKRNIIFVGTVYSLARMNNYVKPHGIIYDEASQLTIPEYYLPISNSKIEFICVVGDDEQLPPVVTLHPLSKSALSYLKGDYGYANIPIPHNRRVILEIQYRMHPVIAQLTRNVLQNQRSVVCGSNVQEVDYGLPKYNNQLIPNLSPHTNSILSDIISSDYPVIILDFAEIGSTNVKSGRSRYNIEEYQLTRAIYQCLMLAYRGIYHFNDIIVCAPYRAQIELALRNEDIRAGTIHQFQGQEAPIVIYQLTFSDPNNRSAFFSETNLMYVGLSRAQKKLIILGDSEGLSHSEVWQLCHKIFEYTYLPDPPHGFPSYINSVKKILVDQQFYNELTTLYRS